MNDTGLDEYTVLTAERYFTIRLIVIFAWTESIGSIDIEVLALGLGDSANSTAAICEAAFDVAADVLDCDPLFVQAALWMEPMANRQPALI
jgi:hypothetical protein